MYPFPRGPLSAVFALAFLADAFLAPPLFKTGLWPDCVFLVILIVVCFESSRQAFALAWMAGIGRDLLGSSPAFGIETAALAAAALAVIAVARKVDRQKPLVFSALALVGAFVYEAAFWSGLSALRPGLAVPIARITSSIVLTTLAAPVFLTLVRRFVSRRSVQYELFSRLWP